MIKFAVKYKSSGTVNGEPVGIVFALDIGAISPGCWSYSKTPREATLFDNYDSAFKVKQRHRWPDSEVVPVAL